MSKETMVTQKQSQPRPIWLTPIDYDVVGGNVLVLNTDYNK